MTHDPLRFRLTINLMIFFAVLIFGTLVFIYLENRPFIDAFYYIIVTIATVGYGDVHPITTAGKVFAILLIIAGVGTFLGVIANSTEIMLSRREKLSRIQKLNMVIGVFFSEAGIELIRIFVDLDPKSEEIRKGLNITQKWTHQDFQVVSDHLKKSQYDIEISKSDLGFLKEFLLVRRDFLIRLLENPSLLEHESFTDLLRAVFHLTEELAYRKDPSHLPESDQRHIAGDMVRVYNLIVKEWLNYMEYLKANYPYLFSLAMRTNPFNRQASPIVES
ncbi:MAG: two pore domain potassium channel family protein [Syntrophaceae bacterium]|nr:two pore domain potassium channel family protein [Syntrophaceae bacterium]